MKKLAAILCLTALATGAFAQGLIKFQNSSTTLVSVGGTAQAGTFYYALLAAAPGTTDRAAFQFTGLYATNTATAGRLQGGSLLGVTANSAWPALTERSFYVAGWSSDLGVTFNQDWLSGNFGAVSTGFFGWSAIATGTSGGPDPVTGQTVPALALWSGTTLTSGFNLTPIPEPTTMALAGLGAAALLIFRRRK